MHHNNIVSYIEVDSRNIKLNLDENNHRYNSNAISTNTVTDKLTMPQHYNNLDTFLNIGPLGTV
eukprot:Pgem_evm2s19138